jgi:tetratricopeptide (TPR) repeat protein
MTPTLNLVDHLLSLGRRYQDLGRNRDALRILGRLAAFRELPAAAAEEAQARLAEIQLKRRKYERARRHLAAALRHSPGSGRYHYLMATSVRAEDRGDLERAAEHYRRSLELDPEQPKCLGEWGLLAVKMGETDEGLAHLRRATELEPDSPEAVARLAKGLRLAGYADEARATLRAALFRNPRAAKFRQLWAEFQLRQLRRRQQAARGPRPAPHARDQEPVLLPFVRADRAHLGSDGAALGGPRTLQGPHAPRGDRRPDQRYVQ